MHQETLRKMKPKVVFLVSSTGGHWTQMLRTLPTFSGHSLIFISTSERDRGDVENERFFLVADASRWSKIKLIGLALKMFFLILKFRPDVVFSTGAAPGYFALMFGKLVGARTIWLDSIANVDRMSLSGRKVKRYADMWLTQWPHLSKAGGPSYKGAVL